MSTIFLAIGIAMYYKAKLGAVALAFTPLVVVASYFQGLLMTGQNIDEKKGIEDASKVAVQSVGNIRTVASLTKEKDFVLMYSESMRAPHK